MQEQFTLRLLGLHWLETLSAAEDRCAHSKVEAILGGEVLSDSTSTSWTVSAAGLFLLRTLTTNHTPEHPVGDQLLPCCGFTMWPDVTSDNVLVLGCPNGVDWSVEHQGNEVRLCAAAGPTIVIPLAEYQTQVLRFADEVEQFYFKSEPKEIPEDEEDAKGYELFWAEWRRRRAQWPA
ncbi:hypothetical protein [Hymenobacter tenuis]